MTIQRRHEMTDAEVAAIQPHRRLRRDLRTPIGEPMAISIRESPCIDEARSGLKRIADSLDAVP